jgi:hypothetical protein
MTYSSDTDHSHSYVLVDQNGNVKAEFSKSEIENADHPIVPFKGLKIVRVGDEENSMAHLDEIFDNLNLDDFL